MVTRIQRPFQSPAIVLVLNRIHEMEDPYASGIADNLGDQVTDIQTYLDTMHDHGWISKERKGRRQVLSINPLEIWRDSKYRHKLSRGSLFTREKDVDASLEQLMANALLYKLFYAVETTTDKNAVNNVDDEQEVWVKGPDTLMDKDELVWYCCDTTLNELLAEIIGTIKALAIQGDTDDHAVDVFTSAYDTWFIEQCQDVLSGEASVEQFEDLIQDMVDNPIDYV